ncbi:MAG: hypothetical protein UIH27_01890, partial [Ruminococcus sp.]|nr:hypothetical protein [Ruminococcus sp.]
MKKILSVLLVASFAAGAVCLNACTTKQEALSAVRSETADSGIYSMDSYESQEVFDFIKVNAGVKYDEFCTTYKFNYLSDGLKIEGYMSIPFSVEQTQKPGKCVMFNHGGNRSLGRLENNTTAAICTVCDRIVVASQY